jgi:RNA polymerase sigma-70 factor (ECF subfamily)
MATLAEQATTDDEALVAAARRGEVAAFGILVERYWKMAVGLALSRIRDPAQAEDLAQESFLKAHAMLPSLRDPSRFAGWLSKIVLQQCANLLRQQQRSKDVLDTQPWSLEAWDGIPEHSPNPGLTESQIHYIRQAVGQLPEKFQTLIVMRFVGGFSAVQIAAQTGRRPGAVRVGLHRAYQALRKALAPLLEEVQS